MKTTFRATLALLSVLAASAGAQAATVVVTPADMSAGPALNKWYVDNLRTMSSAAITGTQPHNGNGSVEMSLANGSGKADFVYTWGFDSNRTLGSLSALSYDWYRDGSSTASPHLMPAFRLSYDADGDAATTNDRGYLIFEQVYNAPSYNAAVPTDQWVSSDIILSNFWMRQFPRGTTPGNTVESYDITLAEWKNGAHPTDAADILSARTAILGIEFGIGSGWDGSFRGNVDNVSFGFGQDATTFNFETSRSDVPEPASLALLGVGLLGVCLQRRKK